MPSQTTIRAFLAALAAFALLLPGCGTPQGAKDPGRARKLFRDAPDDPNVDRLAWVVTEGGKRVATIYMKGTVHTTRDEGTYYFFDTRNTNVEGRKLVGSTEVSAKHVSARRWNTNLRRNRRTQAPKTGRRLSASLCGIT